MFENRAVMFQIPAASGTPTTWNGFSYGRDNESLVPLNENKSTQIKSSGYHDWSRQICENATMEDLDSKAIELARKQYKKKNEGKDIAEEIDSMSDEAFLNKARITIHGRITKAALLLLGKEESDIFFDGYNPQITWKLQGDDGETIDYAHFSIPFLIAVDEVYAKIRNLRYRYMMGQMSLFPNEVDQYESYIIREILHNCIAHQNYNLRGRINIIEFKDKLIFVNEGNFIPGTLEPLFIEGYVPPFYRNDFLAKAMVNLNMIDTVGSGVRRVFNIQRKKFFPMPDYDFFEPNRVKVTIYGKILDENYTKMLFNATDLDIDTVILLDRVQKGLTLTKEQTTHLKSLNLIEGRYPKVFVSSDIAVITDDKAQYIHNKGMDDQYYKDLIIKFIKKYGSATRKDINDLLLPKLPEALTEKNKISRIRYLINLMSKKEMSIKNEGNNRVPKWTINK